MPSARAIDASSAPPRRAARPRRGEETVSRRCVRSSATGHTRRRGARNPPHYCAERARASSARACDTRAAVRRPKARAHRLGGAFTAGASAVWGSSHLGALARGASVSSRLSCRFRRASCVGFVAPLVSASTLLVCRVRRASCVGFDAPRGARAASRQPTNTAAVRLYERAGFETCVVPPSPSSSAL